MHKDRLSTRRRTRRYEARRFAGKKSLRLIIFGVCLCAFLFSGWVLADYAADYIKSRRAAQELQEIYYGAETPGAAATATVAPKATAVPAITPVPEDPSRLPAVYYPGNAAARVSSRFETLKRQNEDIVGWLRIDQLLDEPVVQRDNEYYLRRDYRGYHNVNGSIFMDEQISLKTRPYTVVLYGHNMKTGAMFGSLRNFENLTYYKNNPFLSFDSAYEDGRYVIFAIATVSTQAKDRNFFDFYKIKSSTIAWREEMIKRLKSLSIFTTNIDVQPSDQLLLLVTCVDDEEDRRVVAARRLRNGESELSVKEIVGKSHKQ